MKMKKFSIAGFGLEHRDGKYYVKQDEVEKVFYSRDNAIDWIVNEIRALLENIT